MSTHERVKERLGPEVFHELGELLASLGGFVAVYQRLADAGQADEPFSAEFHRVLGLWITNRCPQDREHFIRHHANAIPE